MKQFGPRGLSHANRGKPSHHRSPKDEQKKIIILLRRHYSDFKPTFAPEKLRERRGLDHDPKTIRAIMITKGLWIPKLARPGSAHRHWRQRKEAFGQLEQFDGSYHPWFEDRGPTCCLLAAIDDATGAITQAKFALHEGVEPVFGFWKHYLLS